MASRIRIFKCAFFYKGYCLAEKHGDDISVKCVAVCENYVNKTDYHKALDTQNEKNKEKTEL